MKYTEKSLTTLAKAYKILAYTTLALIALGGSVRIMNAGLACPDWPLCFGDVIPDYHPQVYFEFIHRVVAGLVSIAAVTLAFFLFRHPQVPRKLKILAGTTLALLLTQVVMGGLTVLLQLHSRVVAAHLGMGTAFFALLLWTHLSLKNLADRPQMVNLPRWFSYFAIVFLITVYAQILLGGMVASHLASLVCTDFPTCHGEWFPTFQGIIGLHVMHRLGAYTVFVFGLVFFVMSRRSVVDLRLRRLTLMVFIALCAQIALGISNVLLLTPPLIAVLHLVIAAKILGFATMIVHRVQVLKSAQNQAGLLAQPGETPQAAWPRPQFAE